MGLCHDERCGPLGKVSMRQDTQSYPDSVRSGASIKAIPGKGSSARRLLVCRALLLAACSGGTDAESAQPANPANPAGGLPLGGGLAAGGRGLMAAAAGTVEVGGGLGGAATTGGTSEGAPTLVAGGSDVSSAASGGGTVTAGGTGSFSRGGVSTAEDSSAGAGHGGAGQAVNGSGGAFAQLGGAPGEAGRAGSSPGGQGASGQGMASGGSSGEGAGAQGVVWGGSSGEGAGAQGAAGRDAEGGSEGSGALQDLSIYLAGDSTVLEYADTANTMDQAGWGQMLPQILSDQVRVVNRAAGGRTARWFHLEGAAARILEEIRPGDYFLVQFGTNDSHRTATFEVAGVTYPRYANPDSDFRRHLTEYFITPARDRGARPVLVTPPPRNSAYCGTGNSLFAYAEAMRDLGALEGVPVFDLNAKTFSHLSGICPAPTPEDFFLLRSDGTVDGTHFQENGARKMAGFLADCMIESRDPLADYLRPRVP